MKSVVIHQAGGPEVLQIEERPIPVATATQTVMHIRAFAVHRYEVLTREGGSPSVKFPRVIGIEAVGEVAEPATNSSLKKGQRVVTINGGFGREFDGSEQEYALVPDDQLHAVEFDGSWAQMAAYPETFYTAFGSIKYTNLKPGQSLLVRGGTTGVGMAAILLAKVLGLTVTATSRRPERLAELTALGADEAVLDDQGKLATAAQYDGVVDMVGAPALEDTLSHLKAGGTYTLVGLLAGKWLWNQFDPFENLYGRRYATVFDGTVYDSWMQEMFQLINQHHLEIPIARVFSLDEIQAAQAYVMQHDRPMGQVIVTTD